LNARANGVAHFEVVASTGSKVCPQGVSTSSWPTRLSCRRRDRHLFIERGRELMTPQGRFFLVTKQPEMVVNVMQETFGNVEAFPLSRVSCAAGLKFVIMPVANWM